MKYWKRILPLLLVLAMLTGIMLPAAALEVTQTLSLNQEVTVTVDWENPELFAFVPTESGLYAFFSSNYDDDPKATVYDSDMNFIQYDDDSGEEWNFNIIWNATAGQTYYLEAAGVGTYTASVEQVTCDSIALDETVSVEPIQMFTFVPEKDGVYIVSSADSEGDPRCYVYDSVMNEIAYDDDGGEGYEFKAFFYGTAGESYILKIDGYGTCQVSVTEAAPVESMTLNRNSFIGDPLINRYVYLSPVFYPEDSFDTNLTWTSSNESVVYVDSEGYVYIQDLGTAVITATTGNGLQASCTITSKVPDDIALNEVVTVEAATGSVCYAFTPAEDGWYRFFSTGDLDTYGVLYDASGDWLASNDSDGQDGNYRMNYCLTAGETYYLLTSIYDAASEETCQIQIVESTVPTSLVLNSGNRSGFVGEELYLSCYVLPEDAYMDNVSWTVSDETVAAIYVQGSDYVVLELLRAGTVTVTATTAGGLTTSCPVRVNVVEDISCGDSVTVDAANGRRRFRFVPEESGSYVFSGTAGVEGSFGYIYDSNMNFIASSYIDWDGSFTTSAWLEAGQEYYLEFNLELEPASGTCVLSVDKVVTATGIQLSQTEITGAPGEYVQLFASLLPENAEEEYISWESSDWNVAEVYGGDVYLRGAGTAVITATVESGASASCTVTVQLPEAQPMQCNQSVTVTETEDFTWFSFTPQTSGWYRFFTQGNGVDPQGDLYDRDANWLYGADDNAENLHFSLGYEMTAGQTYYLRLKFYDADGDDSCTLTLEKMCQPTGITLDDTEWEGYEGTYTMLSAILEPANAIDQVTWSSSDESVAYVTEYGEVELLSLGTATITATTVNGLKATCKITVTEPALVALGDVVTVDATKSDVRFRFIPQEDGWYGFYTTGDFDTYGVLFDSEKYYLTEDDDSAEGYNYLMRYELEAGQEYYVRNTFYDGAANFGTYEFHVEKLQNAQQLVVDDQHLITYPGYGCYLECDFLPVASHWEAVTWTSSDPSVAWIDDNYVVGEAPGTATLTATSESGLTTTVTVEVVEIPENADVYGMCGNSLIWDLQEGVLTITGSGDMYWEYIFGYEFEDEITQVRLPEGLTSISRYAFWGQGFETITIPASVERIDNGAFAECSLQEIRFQGSAPWIHAYAFENVTAIAYYPAGDPTWTEEVRQSYGGDITWVAYGSGEVTGTTVSGSFTTGAEGDVELQLLGNGIDIHTLVSGKTGTYSFENVAPGTYTLYVRRPTYVTREYTITVGSSPVTQDVKICPLGDVDGNGKLNLGDISKLLSHVRGTALITDEYLLECANVNGGRLNMGDIAVLYAHIRGTKSMFG